MRLQYGTLDHLDRKTSGEETALAVKCEKAQPGILRGVTESYRLDADFDRWTRGKQLITVNAVLVMGYTGPVEAGLHKAIEKPMHGLRNWR